MNTKIEKAFGRLEAALARLEDKAASGGDAASREEISVIRGMIGEAISLIGDNGAYEKAAGNGSRRP